MVSKTELDEFEERIAVKIAQAARPTTQPQGPDRFLRVAGLIMPGLGIGIAFLATYVFMTINAASAAHEKLEEKHESKAHATEVNDRQDATLVELTRGFNAVKQNAYEAAVAAGAPRWKLNKPTKDGPHE